MAPEVDPKTETTQNTTTTTPAQPPKAVNPGAVKKAVALGKEIRKQPEKTKADAARPMFEPIAGEPREIILQAFVDGAGLTPKGLKRTSTTASASAAGQPLKLARAQP